jgi:O-antigen ligase
VERRDRLAVAAVPALAVLVAALSRTESRAAWLALLGGAAVTAALRLPRPGAAVVAVLAAAAVVLGVVGVRESEERAAYWPVALAAAGDNPVLGTGAGTWRRAWLAERDEPFAARDAHSLYLETLAEVGPVGLALLAVALGCPLVAAVRARALPFVPAVAGAYAAFVLHVGVDWTWELAAVALAGVLLGAALLAAVRERACVGSTQPPSDRLGASESPTSAPRDSACVGSTQGLLVVPRAFALAGLGAIALLAVGGLGGNTFTARAEDRLRAGDWNAAEREARRAARLAPWAAEPWRLRGEAQLAGGDREAAARSFRAGLDRDEGDVELWRALARAASGEELRRARERAAQLDPLGSR